MRRGFTLIELLVVIAIIAVLAAMLFPVFARARAKARQAQCLSNQKQLALALSMYAGDYDGMMPFWAWSHNASPDPLDNVAILRQPASISFVMKGGEVASNRL